MVALDTVHCTNNAYENIASQLPPVTVMVFVRNWCTKGVVIFDSGGQLAQGQLAKGKLAKGKLPNGKLAKGK